MSLTYRILYRIGLTSWDTDQVPPELSGLIEGHDALPPGRALDVPVRSGLREGERWPRLRR